MHCGRIETPIKHLEHFLLHVQNLVTLVVAVGKSDESLLAHGVNLEGKEDGCKYDTVELVGCELLSAALQMVHITAEVVQCHGDDLSIKVVVVDQLIPPEIEGGYREVNGELERAQSSRPRPRRDRHGIGGHKTISYHSQMIREG